MTFVTNTIKRSIPFVAACQFVGVLVYYHYLSRLLNNRNSPTISVDSARNNIDESKKSTGKNLVVYNALGKYQNNLALVEHSRRTTFNPDEWDCVAFMFVKEDIIPDEDPRLRNLIDELGCSVPRRPGFMWGDFLEFITPTFVSNYDYVAVVLDDIFIPDQGSEMVNVTKMISNMEKYEIHVMQPGISTDHHKVAKTAKKKGLGSCIVEVDSIETYVQLFTRHAWECYYGMLHYTGSSGWCYDRCFKRQCPDFRMAHDFSMRAFHMDRNRKELPLDLIVGTGLEEWIGDAGEKNKSGNPRATCARLSCRGKFPDRMVKISCPFDEV